jgi:hypothetical protein
VALQIKLFITISSKGPRRKTRLSFGNEFPSYAALYMTTTVRVAFKLPSSSRDKSSQASQVKSR